MVLVNKNKIPPEKIKFRWHIIIAGLVLGFLTILFSSLQANQGLVRFGHDTDFYLSNSTNHLWMGQTYAEFSYRAKTQGINWDLSLIHSQPNSSLNWESQGYGTTQSGDDWFSIEAPLNEEYTRIKLNVEAVQNFLHCGTSWRFNSNNRVDFVVNGQIGKTKVLAINLSFGRKYPIPSYVELLYNSVDNLGVFDFEGAKIDLAAPAQIYNVSIVLNAFNNIKLKYANHNAEFSPACPENGYQYHASLDGIYQGEQILLEYALATKYKIITKYYHGQASMAMQTFYDGEIFGHFGNVKGNINLISLKLDSPRWWTRFQFGKADGKLGGNINSWPFARGLAILLGDRRQFIGEADINWIGVSLKSTILESGSLLLNGGFDFLSLSPDISYKTWRPKLWGLGIDNYESDQLSIQRADLLCLKLNPIFKISHYTIEIAASQWIPISIKKYNSASSGSPSSFMNSFSGNKTYGGFAISAIISVVL